MRKIIIAGVLGMVAVLGLGTASAVGSTPVAKNVRPVKVALAHPCDLNKSGRADGSTERLCLVVWGHDAYDVTDKSGGMTSTPAGPVVVTELVAAARLEGKGAAQYIREGLVNEVRMYAARD